MFMSTSADIAIYGGQAGGGKTWSLLLEPLRYINTVPGFGGVIFRRTYPQIALEGGLWDQSMKLYPYAGGMPTKSALQWVFEHGNKITFRHIQHEDDKHDYQGSEIPFIGFDELTHFTRTQFLYMLSRNRSTCGVVPYIRGGCNPDANSWVKIFLAPWLAPDFVQPGEDGFRKLASGEIGYFSGEDGIVRWKSRREYVHELTLPPEDRTVKTVTFVRASVYDNKELLRTNPQYIASLKALPLVDQERLLKGNWDISESGNMFREGWFTLIRDDVVPTRFKKLVRFWDFASTKPSLVKKRAKAEDPDWTAGALLGLGYDGRYYFLDLAYIQETPLVVEQFVRRVTEFDYQRWGKPYEIAIEQEPGASGLFVVQSYQRLLKGYRCSGFLSTGSKIARAKPVSGECQNGNVYMVIGPWNGPFFSQATAFPSVDDETHDDFVDALSGAHNAINTLSEDDIYIPRYKAVSGWSGS